jgi:hypothetical protein
MRIRGWWLVLILAALPGCPPDPNDPYELRGEAIREHIEDNLQRGAHFQKSANAETVAAVRAFVTEDDVYHLLELLGSDEAGVAVTAQLVLQDLGEPMLPFLRRAEDSPDVRVSGLASQAVAAIEAAMAAEARDDER